MLNITPKKYDWFVFPIIAILIVLGFTIVIKWPGMVEEPRREQDMVKMKEYLEFMDTFHYRLEEQPREQWYQRSEDSWGNPFWFFYGDNDAMTMVATGRDGLFDTSDDQHQVRILDGETGS